MTNERPNRRTRVCRSFLLAFLVLLFSQVIPLCAYAKDGPVNVAGKQLDTLYRFKKGIKFFPIEKTCSALGMSARKDGTKWVIEGSYRGKVTAGGRRSNLIERDGIVFAPESFWKNDLGLEVVDNKGTVFVLNRIVEVKKTGDGVLIVTAAPISFKNFTLDKPSRFVYDIPDLSMGVVEKDTKYDFENCPFNSVRLGQFESFPHTGRIVVDAGTNKAFKPIAAIHGPGKNALWIGRTDYVESSTENKKDEKSSSGDAVKVEVGTDGTVTLTGVAYEKASLTHLWDKVPYRAVCKLEGCHLPFKMEREFAGGGNVIRVRLAQNSESVANLVVELNGPIMMMVSRTDKDTVVLSPVQNSFKKGFKVLIDAGHGGNDPGAQVKKSEMGGYCANEKDINLKIALLLGEMLKARGVQVFYTRTDDTFLELTRRRDMATRIGVDLFISIHTNSTPHRPQSFLSGPEVYYYYDRDRKIADVIWRNMSRSTGFQGRGYFSSKLCVVMNEYVPSVLVETAYLNNINDLSALLRPSGEYCQAAALGIADGLSEIYGLPRNQPIGTPGIVETRVDKPNAEDQNLLERKARVLSLDYPPTELPSRGKGGASSNSTKLNAKKEKPDTKTKPQIFTPPDRKVESLKKIIDLGNTIDEKAKTDPELKGKDTLSKDENVTDGKEDEKGKEVLSEKEKKKRKKNIFRLY